MKLLLERVKLSSPTNLSCVMKLLLGKFSISRENVDVKDINKRTPLHWAAAHGCYDQVGSLGFLHKHLFWVNTCLLLKVKILTNKLGADVGLIDVGGKTPLHWAASSSKDDAPRLVSLLIEIKPRSLWHFCFCRKKSKNFMLCTSFSRSESKTVINWQDYEGRQPLHCAVTDSTDAVVAAIIKYYSVFPKILAKRYKD